MAAVQTTHAQSPDENIVEQMDFIINQVRTKYCDRILKLLNDEGSLYHGDMAKRLGLSASGLNAIIRKMQEYDSLLHVDEIGKYKIYSLSNEMKQYFQAKNERIVHLPRSQRRKGLFLPLQRFVQAAGKDWMESLNLCLTGEDFEEPAEVRAAFSDFINQAEQLDKESLLRIEEILENDILIRLFRMHLKFCRDLEND